MNGDKQNYGNLFATPLFENLDKVDSIANNISAKNWVHGKVGKLLIGLTLVFSIIFFSYIAYTSYKYSKLPMSSDEIPVVKSDIEPIKTTPSEPGGEQFSNQDKLIYTNLEDSNFKAQVKPIEHEKEFKDVYDDVKGIRVPAKSEFKKKESSKKASEAIQKKSTDTISTTTKKTKNAKPLAKSKSNTTSQQPKKINNPFDILDAN